MSDPKIDELSVMTQLSYYVTEGSPGYDKTMEWVNSKLSVSRITNFSVINIYRFILFIVFCLSEKKN